MNPSAIEVTGLGKQYIIGANQLGRRPGQETLIDTITDRVRGIFGAPPTSPGKGSLNSFWALKDIDFTVAQGEKVAIIGHNGAGKSTLLKILSRITEPSVGRIELIGRVSSLLEVGTGFHPELTGRENIYLNGAILGLTRSEVRRKFDEIVAFSECERFLDTPIKRYSSGMKVRLAFAVAAHLEPEILVVDEVLAVGDVAFQNKCLGKMKEVSHDSGRTVLFVSHNMMAVEALCERGIVLEHGRVVFDGATREAVHQYYLTSIAASNQEAHEVGEEHYEAESDVGFRGFRTELKLADDRQLDLTIELEAFSKNGRKNIGVGVEILTAHGHLVSSLAPKLTNFIIPDLDVPRRCIFAIDDITRHLASGEYVATVWLSIPRVRPLIRREHVGGFTIPPQDPFGAGVANDYNTYGVANLPVKFSVGSGE